MCVPRTGLTGEQCPEPGSGIQERAPQTVGLGGGQSAGDEMMG